MDRPMGWDRVDERDKRFFLPCNAVSVFAGRSSDPANAICPDIGTDRHRLRGCIGPGGLASPRL